MPVSFPTWSQTKTTSKAGFDKVYKVVDKLGTPINKLSNKIGSEAFWPTTLDKESHKAARILRSFCKDGFYVEEPKDHVPSNEVPRGKVKVIKKIPSEVIKKAKGLAIFTTMRTGLWVSGAGGSGILVARTATGEWSPPSGIMLHTAGLGFLVGVDIYDCVVVINTEKALQAFTKIRCTVGGEISAVAGPVGVGGVLETEIHKRQAPVWTYLKSRGFYAGVQVDGTVIIERSDENERFYGERIGVADILAGKVRHAPYEIRTLMATIKAAQGDTDVDETALPDPEPTPGDLQLDKSDGSSVFGLPDEDDPDPFGVHALEKEGLEIKEAGTNRRPSADAFEYRPSPSSPIFNTFNRQSLDSTYRRHSKRSSQHSIASIDRGTQTDYCGITFTEDVQRDHSPIKKTSENLALETDGEEPKYDALSKTDQTENFPGDEEGATAPVISRARLVTIPKRIPPALPPRSPYRKQPPPSILMNSEPHHSPTEISPRGLGLDLGDVSPTRNHFEHESINSTKEDIDQKINNVQLPPKTEIPTSTSIQDLDHLSPSPRKDGFDEISMSGSDYSRGEPPPETIPPIHNQELDLSPSHTSYEPDIIPLSKETTTSSITPIPAEPIQTHPPDDVIPGKADEFHSVPSTPLEAPVGASFDTRREQGV